VKKKCVLFGAVAGALLAHAAAAAEIKVLSAGAIEPGLKAAAAAFQKETGHAVRIQFNTAPQLRKRIAAGEAWDVVIAPPAAIDEFDKAGKVAAERVSVGRVGLGVAVRPGAPVPDVSNADALKRTVLDAESLVFNRASTGLYFEGLLKKMGVYEQVEGKTTRYPDGASVMEHLLKGKGKEVGFGPITEILLFKDKGLRLVAPLPADVQNYTSYVAAPMAGASDAAVASAFARYLGSPAGKALFVAAGVE
jgi:molybdate transport system substrate-binding protein